MPERNVFNNADFCKKEFYTVELFAHSRVKKLPVNCHGQIIANFIYKSGLVILNLIIQGFPVDFK